MLIFYTFTFPILSVPFCVSLTWPFSLTMLSGIDMLFAGRSIYWFHYLVHARNGLWQVWTVDRLKLLEYLLCVNRLSEFSCVLNMWLTELMTGAGNKRQQFPKRVHHKCWHGDWQRQLGPIKFSAVPDKIGEWECIFGRWTRESWLSQRL